MSYTLGVVFFLFAFLIVSVVAHEGGHFVTAKKFGMKATKFFVGFGPTVWSFRRGETEYGVKAIPAGGFVKIVGMTPLEDVDPGDEDRAFYRQPAGRRAVVLAAGSVVHFLIAIFVLYAVIATTGDPLHTRVLPQVDSTQKCIMLDPNEAHCTAKDPPAPAATALRPGDRIISVDGRQVTSYQPLQSAIRASPGRAITLVVVRQGRELTVSLTPVPVTSGGKTIGLVGFYPVERPAAVSVLGAVPKTFTTLGSFFTSTVSALGGLPHQISLIVNNKPRDGGVSSVVDVARVSGQIAQAHVSLGLRIADLMLIVAELNFFVGIFNLLPLLPLDGGHLGILAFEETRSRVYRLFGRANPGRVDLMKIMPVTYAVVALFIGLSLLLIYAGIVNPIRIQ